MNEPKYIYYCKWHADLKYCVVIRKLNTIYLQNTAWTRVCMFCLITTMSNDTYTYIRKKDRTTKKKQN